MVVPAATWGGDNGGVYCPVTDVQWFLVGEWSLERDIVDTAGGPAGEFSGTAEARFEGGVVVYREQGRMRLGGHEGPASRCLHYHVTGPGQARVFFDYGDFFHELDLRTGYATAQHPCRADLYRGEFAVLDVDNWWQRWVVTGPEKNHVISTRLCRLG